MNILALDIATTTGWAVGDTQGRLIKSGNFYCNKDVFRATRFLNNIIYLHRKFDIKIVVFEKILRTLHKSESSCASYYAMEGRLMEFCHIHKIRPHGILPNILKKSFTGKGNATKDEINIILQAKYGLDITSHDEADAIALYFVFTNNIK